MWLEEVRPEDFGGRTATDLLLPHDPAGALATARAIHHPWYRCQALASVAEALTLKSDALHILGESLAAAHEQHEPNRVVTVASWPLRCLLKIDRNGAVKEVEALLSLAATESHGLRRLHALDALLGAIAQDAPLRERVAEPFLATADICFGWRAECAIALMAQCIATVDFRLAKRMIASRKPNRFINRARHAIHTIEMDEGSINH